MGYDMDKTKDRVSVVINTFNAEKYLVQSLESLSGFDEIVVCDMESTDSTVDIASKYGCRIVTFPKGDNTICEPARDFAIHSAKNSWVLVVDADEVVPDALRNYLYEFISVNPTADAIAIPRLNLFIGRPINDTPDYQLRFFRKEKAFWPPIIHARPKIDGKIINIPASRKDLYLIHLDDPDISSRIIKLNRYTDYEVPKRMHKHYGIGKLIFRPMWFFLRSYFLGGCWKNGKRGIIRAYMSMIYQVTLMSKIIEHNIREK